MTSREVNKLHSHSNHPPLQLHNTMIRTINSDKGTSCPPQTCQSKGPVDQVYRYQQGVSEVSRTITISTPHIVYYIYQISNSILKFHISLGRLMMSNWKQYKFETGHIGTGTCTVHVQMCGWGVTSIHVTIQDKFRQASKSGTRIYRVGIQLGFYIGFIFRVERIVAWGICSN